MSVKARGFPEGSPALERGADWYNNIWSRKPPETWQASTSRFVTFYPALARIEGGIFDVGCGSGVFAKMAIDHGHNYVRGCDFSVIATSKAARANRGAEFHHVDAIGAAHLFRRTDYHTVVALEVLEHVYNDIELLKQVPIGCAVVGSVPNYHTEGHCRWFARAQQVAGRYGRVLKIESVITNKGPSGGSNRYFVFKGVRR